MNRMTRFAIFLALLLPLAAAGSEQPKGAGWLRLFDGESLMGWTAEGGVRATAEAGVLSLEPSAGGWLRTNVPFADFDLQLEFLSAGPIDGGMFVRMPRSGPGGYQVQLGDLAADGYYTGSLVGSSRAARSRLIPNEWQTLGLSVRGSTIVVSVNGKEVASARSFTAPAGYLGFESPAGGAMKLRNVYLRPAGLALLFNGQDLTGWRSVEPPGGTKTPAEWSVRDKVLHVEKGPGQLETEGSWDDFVLQLDIRVNTIDPTRHPAGAVFFRGDQDAWWSGYAAQIRNEFEGSDRSKPVDYGTGGIQGRQPARRVISSDNAWLTKTIVATGRRIAVWVDGFQVADYLDDGAEGMSVREGKARLLRGTISLQARDAATNMDFRNILLAPLPRMPE